MSYTVTFTNTTTLPPKRIYKCYRIRHIGISINPASQTYWVGLGKSSADRVIISEKTVVQPAFTIQVLSLESEVLLYRLQAGQEQRWRTLWVIGWQRRNLRQVGGRLKVVGDRLM